MTAAWTSRPSSASDAPAVTLPNARRDVLARHLEGLDVHAAVMNWRLEGHLGAGLYELTVREPAPAAA